MLPVFRHLLARYNMHGMLHSLYTRFSIFSLQVLAVLLGFRFYLILYLHDRVL
jgi:hypothetical protein